MASPAEVRAWQRIFRDFVITIVATFVLVHETIGNGEPNWQLIATAVTLYGIPPALRLDNQRRSKGDEDDGS